MKKRTLFLFGILTIIALVISSCGGADPTAVPTAPPAPKTQPTPEPAATAVPAAPVAKYGGTFMNRTSGFWRDWDSRSIGLGSGTAAYTIGPVLNGLIVTPPVDMKNLEGSLAESWSWGGNGVTLTLKLRKGVQWQDDVAFTSKDVVFTLDKFLNPAEARLGYHKGRLKAITDFSAVDDHTVTITLDQPTAGFVARLATPSTMVYPAHVPFVDKKLADNPVGTGPFKVATVQKNVAITFSRNTNYWKKDALGGALPYLDSVELHTIKDRALGQASFKTGKLHLLGLAGSDLLASEVPRLQQDMPSAKIHTMTASQPVSLQFNNRPPWNNINVRKAIHAAIDRQQINLVAQGGAGYHPTSLMVPEGAGGQWALPDAEVMKLVGFREPKDQDTALAKKLLADAGIDPSSLKPELLVTTLSPYVDAMTVLTQQLNELGMDPVLMARDSKTVRADVRAGNFDIYLSLTSFTLDDPVEGIFERVLTGGGQNNGKWSFPDIDALAASQEGEMDPAKRRAVLHELQRKVYDQAAEVPFFYFARGIAVQSYVEGFSIVRGFNQSSVFRHEGTWFNK